MIIDSNAPIGVFDSGIGGLTVAREIMRNLPSEKIVYFGDTARLPYGSKSKDTIIRYSRQIVRFLQSRGVKAIVVACNTASALALDTLEKEIDIPIIGVVKPGARVAAQATESKRVGVIATEATIRSGLYTKLIQDIDPEISVIGKPCPLFVPLVEEGWRKDPITEMIARRYIERMVGCIANVTSSKCTLTKKERRAAIRTMLHNPRVDESLAIARPRSRYMKMMLVPIRWKNTYLTWLESAVITYVKERNTKLFAKLKAGR